MAVMWSPSPATPASVARRLVARYADVVRAVWALSVVQAAERSPVRAMLVILEDIRDLLAAMAPGNITRVKRGRRAGGAVEPVWGQSSRRFFAAVNSASVS